MEAHALLARFGVPVTRRVNTLGAYTPSTGEAVLSYVDKVGVGYLVGEKKSYFSEAGTLIRESLNRLYLSPEVGLDLSDTLIIGGRSYSVESVDTVSVNGVCVLYNVVLQR